jgi:hypothetical protein
MAQYNTESSSPFLRLPAKLRWMVWEQHFLSYHHELSLVTQNDYTWNPADNNEIPPTISPDDYVETTCPRLDDLIICKEIHEEAREVYFRVTPISITSPGEYRARKGSEEHRRLARTLILNISCLFITNRSHHADRRPHQSDAEEGVINELREWGKFFGDWDTFGFGMLDDVRINFQQWVQYPLRTTSREQPWTDPDELYRLFLKMSTSTLVSAGCAKSISAQSVLLKNLSKSKSRMPSSTTISTASCKDRLKVTRS